MMLFETGARVVGCCGIMRLGQVPIGWIATVSAKRAAGAPRDPKRAFVHSAWLCRACTLRAMTALVTP